jgi:hypothetical protein
VLLHTQTFCAFDAALAGSWLVKLTSLSPLSWTRLGTDALIDTEPVEVEPMLPWVAAAAGAAESAIAVQTSSCLQLTYLVIDLVPTPF